MVVQEALLAILSELPYYSWYKVIANIGSSTEETNIITLCASPLKSTLAFSGAVKTVVDSTTGSALAANTYHLISSSSHS